MINKFIFLISFTAFHASLYSALEFGSFDLRISQFEQCKGPKRKDCCDVNATITQQYKLDYDLVVRENVKPTKGKIIALTDGKQTLRLQLKNPCDHLFLRPLFQSMMNVTSDCLILKGHYHFFIDIQDVAKRYYAGEFLYGKWTFKAEFHNDHCNFSCSVIQVEIFPKNKVISKKS